MISAVVLTHNDERILERCLRSLSWCDEIIIVDDYSTDQTISLAKKYAKQVYERHLGDDFAAQRNFGLSKTSHTWVLFVDSDEVVPPKLASEIRTAIQQTEVDGFMIRRADLLWGRELKHGEVGKMRLLRLAKKDAGTWMRPVHEVWMVNRRIGELTHPLLHYPHPDVAQFLKNINYYSTLRSQELYRTGVRANALSVLGYPVAKFFFNYVLRRGFLDGTAGAVLAIMMSFHSFLVRAKLYILGGRRVSMTS